MTAMQHLYNRGSADIPFCTHLDLLSSAYIKRVLIVVLFWIVTMLGLLVFVNERAGKKTFLRTTVGTAIMRLSRHNSVCLSICLSFTWVDQSKVVYISTRS